MRGQWHECYGCMLSIIIIIIDLTLDLEIVHELSMTLYLYPQNGWTALHHAAQEGRVNVVQLLIEAHAEINIQSKVCAPI